MTHSESWRPFFMVSLALIIGTMGTALASPLYPIYQQLWDLLPSHITLIFVAYMFGCLATLLFLGRTSNSIGFLKTLQIGLILIVVGLICSVYAQNAIYLSIGRFIIGIASGLMTTSALIGLMQTIPQHHKSHAPQISSIITAIGFGLGPLIGGVIAQFSAAPLVTPYLPIIVGSLLCFVGLCLIKAPPYEAQPFTMAPKLERPDHQHHRVFRIVCLTAFGVFAAFSLFASLAPSFVKDIIPWHGPVVSGTAITSILMISALVQFYSKALLPIRSLQLGLVVLCVSLACLAICIAMQWSLLFFISDILLGIGHGFALLGAFGLIYQITTTENRAAVLSTYLFIGYLGTIVPIVAVGKIADHFGLSISIMLFCAVIGLLFVLLWWAQMRISSKYSK